MVSTGRCDRLAVGAEIDAQDPVNMPFQAIALLEVVNDLSQCGNCLYPRPVFHRLAQLIQLINSTSVLQSLEQRFELQIRGHKILCFQTLSKHFSINLLSFRRLLLLQCISRCPNCQQRQRRQSDNKASQLSYFSPPRHFLFRRFCIASLSTGF